MAPPVLAELGRPVPEQRLLELLRPRRLARELFRVELPALLEPGLGLRRLRSPQIHQPPAHPLKSSGRISIIWMTSQGGEGVDDGLEGPAHRDLGQLSENCFLELLRHGGAPRNSEGRDGRRGLELVALRTAEGFHAALRS